MNGDRPDLDQMLYRVDRATLIEFLAGRLVHDVRNPLQAILMAGEALANGKPDRAESTFLAETICRAAEKLEETARGFSPPPAAVEGPDPKPIAARDAVQAAVGLLGDRTSIGVSVVVNVPASLPPVTAVTEHLEHVLLDLTLNAMEALETHGGGTIAITGVDDGHFVRITIADDGPGMSEDAKRQAFEPFYSTKATPRHPGLGLPVASYLLRKNGGSLALETPVAGIGTLVVARVPIASGIHGQ